MIQLVATSAIARPRRRFRVVRSLAALAVVGLGVTLSSAPATAANASYENVTGSGSSWSANILDAWIRDVKGAGITINYSPSGSTAGRTDFRNGLTAFGVSEIPYGLPDAATGQSDVLPTRPFAYLPIVAGGTSFMYNLKIGGQQVTNLRLSGENVARMFTRDITKWNDPAIQADNPNLELPNREITPVVRSDGSGTTAQFTTWMSKQYAGIWDAYCAKAGISSGGSCGFTSSYPQVAGVVAQNGSVGVSGFVATDAAEGAITYVESSYAISQNFPLVKLLNSAGYYVEPTASAVAVALTLAEVNTDRSNPNTYLTQILDRVYTNPDPRSYPLSSYSYMVIPTDPAPTGVISAGRGRALADFLSYALCEGQQSADELGYSPLPINLVQAAFDQVKLIPPTGDEDSLQIANCNNPTFSSDGSNRLATTAEQPSPCDKADAGVQSPAGTGGTSGRYSDQPNKPTAASRGTGPSAEQCAPGAPAITAGAGGGGGGGPAEGGGGGSSNAAGGAAAGTGAGAATNDVSGPAADGTIIDPETGEILSGSGAIDPETGEVIGTGGGGGSSTVLGQAVSTPRDAGWKVEHTLAALAALSLLAATLGPPLVTRRMSGRINA